MLKDFLRDVNKGKLDLRFRGFFNVEGGTFQVSTGLCTACESCDAGLLAANVWNCSGCGRSNVNTVIAKSGDGDGVYTVWAVWHRQEQKFLGIICFFDSDYALASASRRSLEEEDLTPDFEPLISSTVGIYADTKRVVRGLLSGDNEVHIGGSPFGLDMQQPFINFYTLGEDFVLSLFVEEPGEHSGAYNNDLEHKPRAVLVLNSEYSSLAGPEDIPNDRIDWAQEEQASLMVMVASHLEPMAETIPPMNFLTHYSLIDRTQPLVVDNDIELEHAASWALFELIVNGNRNLVDLMIEEKWDFSQSDVQEILESRGLVESAQDLNVDLIGFRPTSSSAETPQALGGIKKTSSGLSKSSSGGLSISDTEGNGLGAGHRDITGSESDRLAVTHKFCFECGSKLPGAVRFCPNCGTKLV